MKKITKIMSKIMLAMMFFSYVISPLVVTAAVKYYGKVITTQGLSVREGPGTSYNKIGELAYNTEVELVSGSPASISGCSGGWYGINYNDKVAYVCGTYLSKYSKSNNSNGVASTSYEKELESLGFPSTYWDYLTELHEKHPNWQFETIKTGLDWSNSVALQSVVGVSLIETEYDGWKSIAAGSYDPNTKTFKVLEGSSWYAAAPGVVAYYMDPRNFLDEKHVFMFEKLNYDASYQSEEAVRNVFSGGNMGDYASTFVSAGAAYNVNPIYLASRVRQEVGINRGDSRATSGESFTYDGKTYSGLYNVYNIGATTGASPVLKGLVWANGTADGSSTTYGRAWRSIEASITGGAEFIASSYIGKGQYTNYLQRFNVDPNSSYTALTHGYMTNIKAVFSESVSTYNSYEKMNLLGNNFKFAIPVYNNMPQNTTLPDTEFNPDNVNSSQTEQAPAVDANGVVNSIGLKTDGTYISGIKEGMSVDSLVTSLRNNGAEVSTKCHDNLATGDTFVINGKTYTVILYGDLNSDSKISLGDLVQSKKYILGYNNLAGNTEKAADINKDGQISLTDLVAMKKKILNIADIEQ